MLDGFGGQVGVGKSGCIAVIGGGLKTTLFYCLERAYMKSIKNIFAISLTIIISLVVGSCDLTSTGDHTIPFEEIQMQGMDRVSIGGKLEVVINSQEEYEELIYQRFQKPLDDYWNTNYQSVLQTVKEQNPGLTDEEYEELVREIFYSTLPFKGTENYIHPKINFNQYTLLGQDANSGGCELPAYKIEVLKNGTEYVYRITIKQIGNCEMSILKNKWILIRKIPTGSNVKFEKIEIE